MPSVTGELTVTVVCIFLIIVEVSVSSAGQSQMKWPMVPHLKEAFDLALTSLTSSISSVCRVIILAAEAKLTLSGY